MKHDDLYTLTGEALVKQIETEVELRQQIETLKRQRDGLLASLKMYGTHLAGCGFGCTCGLRAEIEKASRG